MNPFASFYLQFSRLENTKRFKWPPDFETKFRAAPGVETRLEELKQAGADPEAVVTGIVFVFPALAYRRRGAIARTRKQLKQLQTQVTRLANDLKRIEWRVRAAVSNPLSNAAFWRSSLLNGPKDLTAFHEKWTAARRRTREIEALVHYFRSEADSIKSIPEQWQEYEESNSLEELRRLLRYIKRTNGQHHDDRMADLLQAACNVLGIKASPDDVLTAEGIKKLRQRKLHDLIRDNRGQHPPKN